MPSKVVEARHCKNLIAYATSCEEIFMDREAHLFCRKGKHSTKQNCVPQTCFFEALIVAHDEGRPSFEKIFLYLKQFFYWLRMYKWERIRTRSCLTWKKRSSSKRPKYRFEGEVTRIGTLSVPHCTQWKQRTYQPNE